MKPNTKRITNIFQRSILAGIILFLSFPTPSLAAAAPVSNAPQEGEIQRIASGKVPAKLSQTNWTQIQAIPPQPAATVLNSQQPFLKASSFESKPVWRALMLVYLNTDVNYVDSVGTQRHLKTSLPADEMENALWSFRRAASIAHDFSNGEVIIDYDIIYVTRPITSVTSLGSNGYWASPTDTQIELDLYAPPGKYDSIFVHWMKCDVDTEQCIPSFGWGWGMQPTSWANGATYATVTEASVYVWQTPSVGEVWLHEWLHGVCSFYGDQGYAMPTDCADGGGSHGYVWSYETGWGEFYRDLMTGQVLEGGTNTGIFPAAWHSGTIIDYRPKIFVDYYSSDSLQNYENFGTVTWQNNKEDIALGVATASDNWMYVNIVPNNSFIVKGRVYIPDTNVGSYDSVSIAIGNDQVKYWATLAYGNDLTEKNNIAIMRNEIWGPLYPISLASGWYTVKVFVDYKTQIIKMKTWADGNNEPDWQVSHSLDTGWTATQIGFRHYGQGTYVDDLSISSPPIFEDVPATHWAYSFIETLYTNGVTGGCSPSPLNYCPETTVTRSQMAVFLLRGIHSSTYNPPAVGASTAFGDVPTDYWSAGWIKQLSAEGITGGCGSGNYCPEYPVTRDQMAVFLLRSKYGSSYSPPAVEASTGFGDVPTNHWAAAWIKQLVTEGITAGCGNGNYCPDTPVTRAQMAVFLVKTFSLP